MADHAEIIDAYFRAKNYYPHVPYQPVGQVMVEEVERMGQDGLYLSTAAALVEKESGGKNIFGCDWGTHWTNEPPYCQVAVTAERVRALIRNVNNGGGQNGVGLTQLTSIGLVQEAERLGGAHLPRFQMRVGFRYLNDLIAQLGWPAGTAAYNAGAGNWRAVIDTYGADMARLEREWAARLAKAEPIRTTTPEVEDVPNYEKALAYIERIVGAPYSWWTNVAQGLGPKAPAWASDASPPPPADVKRLGVFCAGVGNLGRRACLLPYLRNGIYPGGTGAWQKLPSVPFELGKLRRGDVLFRSFRDTTDQGHWAVATGGADDPVIQSFATSRGTVFPGVTKRYTARESHDGGYYTRIIRREVAWS